MLNTNEKNKVLIMSMLNFLGFGVQITFSLIAINSTNQASIILSLIICFAWLSFFTIRGLRQAGAGYPAADMVALAWPSFIVAFFVAMIVIYSFGINIH